MDTEIGEDSDFESEANQQTYTRKLETRIHSLELMLAERKPVSELMKIFLFFFFALSSVLGFFGWNKFSSLDKVINEYSDLDDVISKQIRAHLPKSSSEFESYKELMTETERLKADFDELTSEYKTALENYSKFEILKEQDLEGEIQMIVKTSTERAATSKDSDGDETGENGLYEKKWRQEAISTLTMLTQEEDLSQYDEDLIFNAAQACSRLGKHGLSLTLMKAAFEANPNDQAIKAGMLSETVRSSPTPEERETAFQELMTMVTSLSLDSPQIVLSESWNAAEEQRRYTDLIEAIETAESDPDAFKPAYLFMIKANCILRRSFPGCIEEAEIEIGKATQALAHESAHSLWFESTLRDLQELTGVIETSRQIPALVAAVSESDLPRLVSRSASVDSTPDQEMEDLHTFEDVEKDPALYRKIARDNEIDISLMEETAKANFVANVICHLEDVDPENLSELERLALIAVAVEIAETLSEEEPRTKPKKLPAAKAEPDQAASDGATSGAEGQ